MKKYGAKGMQALASAGRRGNPKADDKYISSLRERLSLLHQRMQHASLRMYAEMEGEYAYIKRTIKFYEEHGRLPGYRELDRERNPTGDFAHQAGRAHNPAIYVADPLFSQRTIPATYEDGFILVPSRDAAGSTEVYRAAASTDYGSTRPDHPAPLPQSSRIGAIRLGHRKAGKYTISWLYGVDGDTLISLSHRLDYLHQKGLISQPADADQDIVRREYPNKLAAAKAVGRLHTRLLGRRKANPAGDSAHHKAEAYTSSILKSIDLSGQFYEVMREHPGVSLTIRRHDDGDLTALVRDMYQQPAGPEVVLLGTKWATCTTTRCTTERWRDGYPGWRIRDGPKSSSTCAIWSTLQYWVMSWTARL
jgi:hypothetical protein